ncbi:MAG: double-strand break repair helicase AddA [Robiginitomaculum sp.]|nr:double-strand break repair helicase AddA [Robiginitomaculum sp.]
MNDAYKNALQMQSKAARPDTSVFVSANAGSGKTRVLVERVSRILLTGTNPDKIMCLTYTKAAASEMQTRLFAALGDWAIMSEAKLTEKLNTLENKSGPRSQKSLNRARSLFARALETPGGLKVQTIHAFCERLLKRFPLEAGISPGTDAVDERDARKLQEQVWTEIETEAVGDPDGELAQAITLLSVIKNDEAMDKIYGWAMDNIYKVESWQETGGVDKLADLLGLDAKATPETIIAGFWAHSDLDNIRAAATGMMDSGPRDLGRGSLALKALEEPDPVMAFNTYLQVFCSGKGEKTVFKPVASNKASDYAKQFFGNDKDNPSYEANRLVATRDKLRGVNVLQLTKAAYRLCVLAAAKYRALKARRRVIDFSDMIYLARNLLINSQAREWVRFKLDEGVEHILVDEAQDTSRTQWDIVDALSDEFFQTGAGTKTRTVFAVGDEKQSIYGFQGAEPELFLDKIQELTKKQPNTQDVKMSMSFRSTKQVLALVDQIYYENKGILETFDASFFPPASDKGQHEAHRGDDGIIEFWPASQKPEDGELETSWAPIPVDKLDARSSREKLAHGIAMQAKDWLDTAEPIFDRKLEATRPIRPSDILILVQKRSAFFGALIRNLKDAGVPVAGADRLKLTDSIAVQDMLSLAKFTLLPSDDLSLAEVLKSPLFGWDDARLFDVAYGRKGSLWATLPDGPERKTLARIKSMAAKFAPYEFFARILALVPEDGEPSMLQKIYARLGPEAADVLDAFLSRALTHQRHGAPSLQRFIADIEASEATIKREMDAGQNEVRVMTVHGAKGLEAPVVILPDTTQAVGKSKNIFFKMDDGFALRMSGNAAPEALTKLEDELKAVAEREAMRLLYVALTRAESRLLICGFESNGKVDDTSWHRRIETALRGMIGVSTIETPFGDGLRYGLPAKPAVKTTEAPQQNIDLPDWVRTIVVPPPPSVRFLSPSQLVKPDDADKSNQPVRSPLSKADDNLRFARGNLIHKLLEILPQLPNDKRRTSALAYLRKQGLDTPDAEALCAEVFAVIDNPDFALVFAPDSKAEVSLAGGAAELPDNIRLSGQIDRLCITDDSVWIVDYKSNRPPPKDEADVAPLYVRQMAAYRALARELYPDKTIRTALLWTDGPHMMVLSDALLNKVNWRDVLPA